MWMKRQLNSDPVGKVGDDPDWKKVIMTVAYRGDKNVESLIRVMYPKGEIRIERDGRIAIGYISRKTVL